MRNTHGEQEKETVKIGFVREVSNLCVMERRPAQVSTHYISMVHRYRVPQLLGYSLAGNCHDALREFVSWFQTERRA